MDSEKTPPQDTSDGVGKISAMDSPFRGEPADLVIYDETAPPGWVPFSAAEWEAIRATQAELMDRAAEMGWI